MFTGIVLTIPRVVYVTPSYKLSRAILSILFHLELMCCIQVPSFPISVAPTKVLIVPLSTHQDFVPLTKRITEDLRELGISCRADESSASIGKRYARNDELGIPLGITIDFDSVKDGTITLRERDSTKQVRASQEEVFVAIESLINGKEKWEDVFARLPEFLGQSGDE